MNKKRMIRRISIGGLLTAMAVLFQSAPVFLPVLGLVLSPLSTLPIAIAAAMNIFLGIIVLISSAFILIIVNPQEAIILVFSTGLLGTVLGALLYRKGAFVSISGSAVSLLLGMIVLTYIAAIPAFVEFSETFSFLIVLVIFATFSLLYVCTWYLCLRRFTKYLDVMKRIQ